MVCPFVPTHPFVSCPAEDFRARRAPPKSAYTSTTTTLQQLRLPPIYRPYSPANVLKQSDMPGRACHNCPQRNRGGCRWVNQPTRRCTTHTYVCPRHNSAYQTYQSFLSCQGERDAAERRLRAGTSEPEPSGNRNDQSHNNVSRSPRNNRQNRRR